MARTKWTEPSKAKQKSKITSFLAPSLPAHRLPLGHLPPVSIGLDRHQGSKISSHRPSQEAT